MNPQDSYFPSHRVPDCSQSTNDATSVSKRLRRFQIIIYLLYTLKLTRISNQDPNVDITYAPKLP